MLWGLAGNVRVKRWYSWEGRVGTEFVSLLIYSYSFKL
jgi:hypothetical protein